GHAGTLDPAATGVLPLAVGAARKTLEFLAEASKTYEAAIAFGVETDTWDRDGAVVATADASDLTRGQIEAGLTPFRGSFAQTPPMHSAIKIGGRKLYELARKGEEVERPPRPVTIHALDLLAWEPPVARLRIDCSKGTYIRSLAHDLGAALGTGAHLSALRRTRAGPFTLADAVTLEALAAADLPAAWPRLALPPDAPLVDWPALRLDPEAAARWRHGRPIPAADGAAGRCRVYDNAGAWLGIGEATPDGRAWRPTKVVERAA
ncbi:MAG TPA: tRNA pseudouridine(55) synthase TruB, partial [Thermomicrobiales bacterium]|nr:tRNA pseudouridine(55) synthase TruB [Thermomicrobiales bacterium]